MTVFLVRSSRNVGSFVLIACRSKPLQIWDKKGRLLLYEVLMIVLIQILTATFFVVRNGHIKRITDPDIQSSVLEIMGTNVSTTYICCPADQKKNLGIKLPFLVMIIKNVSKTAEASSSSIGDNLIIIANFCLVEKVLHFRGHGT